MALFHPIVEPIVFNEEPGASGFTSLRVGKQHPDLFFPVSFPFHRRTAFHLYKPEIPVRTANDQVFAVYVRFWSVDTVTCPDENGSGFGSVRGFDLVRREWHAWSV